MSDQRKATNLEEQQKAVKEKKQKQALKNRVASLAKQGPPNSFRIPTKEQVEKPKDSLDRKEARTYVLGVRAPKTWVGEEVIFVAEHQPFHYTATCDKATTALQISRTDMFETLGRLFPDYMNALLKRTQARYRMHKQRR